MGPKFQIARNQSRAINVFNLGYSQLARKRKLLLFVVLSFPFQVSIKNTTTSTTSTKLGMLWPSKLHS